MQYLRMHKKYLVIFIQALEVTSFDELSHSLCTKSDTIIEITHPEHTVCRSQLVAWHKSCVALTMIIDSTISLKP
jgi:hypothetical protein